VNGIPTDHLPFNPWAFTPATRERQPVDNTGTPGDGPPERRTKSVWGKWGHGRKPTRVRNLTSGDEYETVADAARSVGCSRNGVRNVCAGGQSIKGVRLEYIK
jgi:hypothetical protein